MRTDSAMWAGRYSSRYLYVFHNLECGVRTRKLIGALAVATATIGGVLMVAGGSAYADTATPTFHEGNATTCSGGTFPAGLSGDILFSGGGDVSVPAGSADVADDNKSLAVTINAGFTASGIVVKAGTATTSTPDRSWARSP